MPLSKGVRRIRAWRHFQATKQHVVKRGVAKFLNMVFNMGTMTDPELIEHLGGPTKVAALLNLDKEAGGVQRVQNWITRGIPPKVKLEHPHIFLGHLVAAKAVA